LHQRSPFDFHANLVDMEQQGIVYLVGAGPGDRQYLTIAARDCLVTAQVLIYDALTDPGLRSWVPDDCDYIDVGKRGGQPSMAQDDINKLLVLHCQAGKRVVRLKSGDPFIFGRSASEIEALRSANCTYRVIPGLSSALAAPLLAGIPLTDPVLSRGFGVFSAHDLDALNWQAIAQLDTLVLLMGGRQLAGIIHQLKRHDRAPQTPIAVLRWAGQPEQQIWTGTLLTIEQIVGRSPLSPCVIVVGEVVGLREFLQPEPSDD
jgi:uroporphyrinogen III methyltransferase / synthase